MAQAATGKISPRALAGWLFLGAFTLLLLFVAAVVLLVGLPYYFTPIHARPDHALYDWYASNRVVGLLLGMVGTGLMTIMLLYSVRKWIPMLTFMGSTQFWMRFHMVCGLLGPMFILLHAELKLPSGYIGVGFWCMVLVAISGFFGRYLFGYFPATAADLKVDLQQAQKRLTELRAQLVADTRDANALQVAGAVKLARDLKFEPRTLGELIILDADVRRRVNLIKILLYRAGLPPAARKRAEKTLIQQLELRRSMAGFDVARRLLRYWSLLHQPLAVAMYLIMFVHIVNAIIFAGSIQVLLGGL
ncbi:MAG: hypothetical protein ABMB14_19400 [Myxococcota bacterium]